MSSLSATPALLPSRDHFWSGYFFGLVSVLVVAITFFWVSEQRESRHRAVEVRPSPINTFEIYCPPTASHPGVSETLAPIEGDPKPDRSVWTIRRSTKKGVESYKLQPVSISP